MQSIKGVNGGNFRSNRWRIFLGNPTECSVLNCFRWWMPTSLMQGWSLAVQNCSFPGCLKNTHTHTTALSFSEVGVIYKLICGKKVLSLILCSFSCLFIYPTFTKRSPNAMYILCCLLETQRLIPEALSWATSCKADTEELGLHWGGAELLTFPGRGRVGWG